MVDNLALLDSAWLKLIGLLAKHGDTREMADAAARVEEQRIAAGLPSLETLQTSGWFMASAKVQ